MLVMLWLMICSVVRLVDSVLVLMLRVEDMLVIYEVGK